ncbi:MAG: hypothetical protein ACI38Q_04095 [Candidatus Bruticola sp.]
MSSEQVEKLQDTSSSDSVEEIAAKAAADSCEAVEANRQNEPEKETVVELQPSNVANTEQTLKKENEKEPIDWFSLFLIVLVLANVGYWLTTRHRSFGPDMRVFLTSPSEQRFPIRNDDKAPAQGMLPPQVAAQGQRSAANTSPALDTSGQGPSRAENSDHSQSTSNTSSRSVAEPNSGVLVEKSSGFAPSPSPESAAPAHPESAAAKSAWDSESEEELALNVRLPDAPFVPSFEGRSLTIASAAQSGAAYEVKRDFLVNQYMYAAEVLDMYRVDTKAIFDCDANAQKFSVSGDNEAEMRAVQRTIEISRELMRKTYNSEVAKAMAASKLKGQDLKAVQNDAKEAEALLSVNFSLSAEKYEDVLRRLKSK